MNQSSIFASTLRCLARILSETDVGYYSRLPTKCSRPYSGCLMILFQIQGGLPHIPSNHYDQQVVRVPIQVLAL